MHHSTGNSLSGVLCEPCTSQDLYWMYGKMYLVYGAGMARIRYMDNHSNVCPPKKVMRERLLVSCSFCSTYSRESWGLHSHCVNCEMMRLMQDLEKFRANNTSEKPCKKHAEVFLFKDPGAPMESQKAIQKACRSPPFQGPWSSHGVQTNQGSLISSDVSLGVGHSVSI